MKSLEKNYDPHIEEGIYQNWLDNKYFHVEPDDSREPFTIVIPPPNVTGQLHMGHALNNTIQDILIRAKRMQGYNALWMPGTDHASISTEVKIVDALAKENVTKTDIGRDEFLRRAWAWKDQYGGTIIHQLKRLGCSCDWDRERFTMDEGLSNAVLEVFIRLYNDGKIYRGEKLINWCPKCQTTISDAEVEHRDQKSLFYHFRYPIKGSGDYMYFATTRPETMLGDTAIAVNPKDERYQHLVGQTVTVPFVNREIPIIADEYVEMDFGTGVVKITPAHDPNDFEVGERHALPRVNIMNDDGTLNKNAGPYEGLDRYEARAKIIEECKTLGLFVKTEEISNAIGIHDRCNDVIEPLMKLQWFVKMEELAKPAVEKFKSGELRIHPDRMGKLYMHWLEGIRDWCISRQLWWGHRIPAYYCECGHIEVSVCAPETCSQCGGHAFTQDEDVLDTWFSSALWPFSTLGWPEKTKELEYFYPTNVLVTAADIIFFWVIRMVFSGMEFMGELPFKDVIFTGLVRDSQGQKMSKSLGNGIDPLEVIDQYGADALRLMLLSGNAIENDTRFYWERLDVARNFLNKVWNATRFILMHLPEDYPQVEAAALTMADKWILSKLNTLVKEVTEKIDSYDLGMAVQKIIDFVWDEFCDWYIEMVKPRLYNHDDPTHDAALWTLRTVLMTALQLLHPYVPFITEEIFLSLQDEEETIMLSVWPLPREDRSFPAEEKEIELVKEAVKNIRNIRAEMNVTPSAKIKIVLVSEDAALRDSFDRSRIFFTLLSGAAEFLIQPDKNGIGDDAVSSVIPNGIIYLPLDQLIDITKEKERLSKEKKRLTKEVERVTAKLNNEGFISKAPANLIAEEKEKSAKYSEMLRQVDDQIKRLER